MSQSNPAVRIETSLGTIKIELDSEKAPITVKNFLGYVRSGFYENTVFHRVVPGFMIQGGGLTADLQKRLTRWAIKNEADNGLTNDRGTIAMARTQDVDSATAQFFINVVDNDFLNHQGRTPEAFGYAVFGRVVEGMETVDEIQNVPTGNSRGLQDVPKEPVVIKRIEVLD